jgi:hypothetical protein
MSKIRYVEKDFSESSLVTIAQANDIIAEYQEQGYTLTLRQLYYQFVSRDLIPNNMKAYKRVGSIVNDARLAGLIDWNAIEDRTRNLEAQQTWDSPRQILQACAESFKYDWWANQDTRVEVWVEKEALVGVIERAAFKYRCPYFACRGYTSQSEAWRAGQRFKEYGNNGQDVVVLHLGDHDPSGIDMTRDNDARLQLFSGVCNVKVKRLALHMKQVAQYNPPPNPAKMTDSRAKDYIAQFGRSSWELDALDPKVIDKLISTNIAMYIDSDKWNESKERETAARAKIATMAKNWKN